MNAPPVSIKERKPPGSKWFAPSFNVRQLAMLGRKSDAIKFLMECDNDEWDIKHTWEYHRPKASNSLDDRYYSMMLDRTFNKFGRLS